MKMNLTFLSKKILHSNHSKTFSVIRSLSTQEDMERRSHLFSLEKKRQLDNVGRVEKIEVKYKGIPNDCTMIMNKDISTPFDCARHLSEWHMESSALALLDGQVHWDMHRPLTDSCTLELQTYTGPDPTAVNRAFWRTCSLLLGAAAAAALRPELPALLHSFPQPDIRSGSFTCDMELPSLPDWRPTQAELRALSAEFVKLTRAAPAVERLQVSEPLALEMFVNNPHKTRQIPSIARAHGSVTLYRAGRHVDISQGPLVGSAAQVGRVTVAAVHRLNAEDPAAPRLYRLQGVALPRGAALNHFAYSLLEERAKKFNPVKQFSVEGEERRRAAQA